MVEVEEIDDDLEYEVTHECEKYGSVEKVVVYQERQGVEENAITIVKVFVVFATAIGKLYDTRRHSTNLSLLWDSVLIYKPVYGLIV